MLLFGGSRLSSINNNYLAYSTTGSHLVQRWDDPIDQIRHGNVIWLTPGEKHWHGASLVRL